MIRVDDLPESENVEDRRGEKPAKDMTFAEMAEQAKKRKPTNLSPGDPTSQLAKDLGVDDIKPDDGG